MHARSRAIMGVTFRASRPWWRRLCRARAARGRPASSARWRPRTAPRSPPSCAVMGPLLEEKAEALFDPAKLLYLGTANSGTRICVSRKDSKIKTFDDARTQKAAFGGVSSNDSTREYGYMLKKTAGAQYDVVSSYSGTAEIALAVERGEIDGACRSDWASFQSQRPDWIRDNKVNLLLQVGLEPNAELTRMGVPARFKYATHEGDRKRVELA